jgi:hypothetical protein
MSMGQQQGLQLRQAAGSKGIGRDRARVVTKGGRLGLTSLFMALGIVRIVLVVAAAGEESSLHRVAGVGALPLLLVLVVRSKLKKWARRSGRGSC